MSEVTGWMVTPSMPRCTVPLSIELRHDVLRHVGRNREADADVAARGRQDLRVDADQLAARVDQRAAGVALVDRRVGLDEVLEAAVADAGRAALRADDAHGDGLADAERIADGEHDVADAHRVGVAERQRRAGCSPSIFSTARSLGASEPTTFALKLRPSVSSTVDLLGAVDHVVVGEDVAVRRAR